MSTDIYTREECVKLIDELEVIQYNTQIRIQKKNITTQLMESILFHTNKCRDKLGERIYWILNDIEDYPLCKECGNKYQPKFYGPKNGYWNAIFCSPRCATLNSGTKEKNKKTCLERYGVEYSFQSSIMRDKSKQTNLNKLGYEYPAQSPIIQEKTKQTCMNLYNVEHISQRIETKEKRKETCLERYGVEYSFQSSIMRDKSKQTNLNKLGYEYPAQSPIIQEKTKQTFLKNLGYTNPMHSPEIRAKVEATCEERYNVKSVMQNVDIFLRQQRNAFKLKELILPSGRIINYQGYENIAIFKLLENGYLEEQVITETIDIPQIKYQFDNKDRTYYPDIFIPHENKIIEVKSTYTYSSNLETNLAKRQACLDAGFNFEFWICSDKEVIERL